jgi:hypothetical protein
MRKSIAKILTSLLLMVFSAIFVYGCAKNENLENVNIDRGKFAKEIDEDDVEFVNINTKDGGPTGYMEIDEDTAQGSDTMAALLHLFTVAEHNYYRAKHVARISLGEGSASAEDILSGKMAVRSFMVRDGDRVYSQTVGRVYEGTEALLSAARMVLDQGKRTLTVNFRTDNEITYKQEPKNSGDPDIQVEDFPYARCNFNKDKVKTIDKNTPDEDDFSLKYKGELTNFKIDSSTIVDGSYSVEYMDDDDIYKIVFEVDVANDKAVERPRASLRKSANSDDLQYKKYKVIMELWDNGLIRTYKTEESWEGTLKLIGNKGLNGKSESTNVDYYSWDRDDANIDEYVKEGILSIDWIP